MEEVLRQRLMRRIESLPEAQIYQVLDFIEFLESKYARAANVEPSMLQKFAEGVQDKMRKKAMNPATLREAFQLIAAADRVLADVASAGKQILDELGGAVEPPPPRVGPGASRTGSAAGGGTTRASGGSSVRPGSGQAARREEGAGEGRRSPTSEGLEARDEVGFGEEWTPHGKPRKPGS
jgi:hypothetical protein